MAPSPRLRIAAAALEAEARPTLAGRAARGVAQLVVGRLDEAVTSLEEAVRGEPTSAPFQSDLAVCYLERAARQARPADYARALAAAERALRADPTHLPARFNRALALESLHLTAGNGPWASFHDPDAPGWAAEARDRRDLLLHRRRERATAQAALRKRLVAGDPKPLAQGGSRQQVREWLEDEQLVAWGTAVLRDDGPAAARLLYHATSVAEELAAANGDAMPLAGVAAIAAAYKRGDRPGLQALARAHVRFAEARKLLAALSLESAATAAARAAADFDAGGSPYALWAPVYKAIANRMAGRQAETLAGLERLGPHRVTAGFRHWHGRVVWTRAVAESNLGHFDVSGREFEEAVRLFEQSGEGGHEALMRALLAEILRDLGDFTTAWDHEARALASLEEGFVYPPPDMILSLGALLSLSEGLPEAALPFHDAHVAEDLRRGNWSRLPEARVQRANTLSLLGRWDDAERDLVQAAEEASRLPPGGFRERMAAEIDASRASHYPVAAERAIRAASAAIEYFDKAGHPPRVVMLLIARARAHRSRGNLATAESDFALAIRSFEAQRARLVSATDQSLSLEDGRAVYADMIHLQAVVRGRPNQALAHAERSRTWGIPRSAVRHLPPPLDDPASVGPRIPKGTAILYYVLLDDRLLTWVLRRQGTEHFETRVERVRLESMVRGLRSAILNGATRAEVARQGAPLWGLVLQNVATRIAGAKRMVVLPDGMLHELPFAALVQPSGRYLIEDISLEFAPTLAVAVRHLQPSVRRNVLAVGDGNVPTASLPRLQMADAEAKAVGDLYPRADVLAGGAATVPSFLGKAPLADVIHFAGHGVANLENPRYSRLLLAPGQGSADSGWLLAQDIGELSLPRTDVVVLAACASAAGRNVSGEGPLNLVRPFLTAGARYVVASLWEVDDHTSGPFFGRFHRELASGVASGSALQAAQIAALRSQDPAVSRPAAWGGVVAYGGGVSVNQAALGRPPREQRRLQ